MASSIASARCHAGVSEECPRQPSRLAKWRGRCSCFAIRANAGNDFEGRDPEPRRRQLQRAQKTKRPQPESGCGR